jgi:hypothetical protein
MFQGVISGQIVFNQLRIGCVNQKQEQFKLLLAFWGLVVSPSSKVTLIEKVYFQINSWVNKKKS